VSWFSGARKSEPSWGALKGRVGNRRVGVGSDHGDYRVDTSDMIDWALGVEKFNNVGISTISMNNGVEIHWGRIDEKRLFFTFSSFQSTLRVQSDTFLFTFEHEVICLSTSLFPTFQHNLKWKPNALFSRLVFIQFLEVSTYDIPLTSPQHYHPTVDHIFTTFNPHINEFTPPCKIPLFSPLPLFYFHHNLHHRIYLLNSYQ